MHLYVHSWLTRPRNTRPQTQAPRNTIAGRVDRTITDRRDKQASVAFVLGGRVPEGKCCDEIKLRKAVQQRF